METEVLVTTNPVPSTYIEENTKQWQEGTYPKWINMKDGRVFEYSKYAVVRYTDNKVYVSNVDKNVAEPTKSSNWSLFEAGKLPSSIMVYGPIGYSSSGTTLQQVSKEEPVNSDMYSANIVTSDSLLDAFTTVKFKVNNTNVVTNDSIIVNVREYGLADVTSYEVRAVVGNKGFWIVLRNCSDKPLSEKVFINYKIFKGN